MRVTTAFKRLLRLGAVNVTAVEFMASMVVVTVRLRRWRLVCPHCGFTTSACHDLRPGMSSWRHLDLGVWQVTVQARLRRLRCPIHGVIVEGVPFARPGAHLTRDFDDLLAWLATRMDKTAVARLCRVSWRTVGRACERVVAAELAVAKAGERARGGAGASDAFFPFPDGLEVLARAGVAAVVQPGGSIRDGEVIAVADAMGLAMVTTGERHFRH